MFLFISEVKTYNPSADSTLETKKRKREGLDEEDEQKSEGMELKFPYDQILHLFSCVPNWGIFVAYFVVRCCWLSLTYESRALFAMSS